MRILWIGVAGFCGAVARYQLDSLVGHYERGAFPWGTLLVNVSGCFLLGVLFTWSSGRFDANPSLRPALTIGFLGAYTTFSTFSLQAVRLSEDGKVGLALGYVAASVGVGLLAAWAGMAAGRAWT
ncbi:MAG: fluoride efflux transporter CrcB [Acidimicrobiales bacterium]